MRRYSLKSGDVSDVVTDNESLTCLYPRACVTVLGIWKCIMTTQFWSPSDLGQQHVTFTRIAPELVASFRCLLLQLYSDERLAWNPEQYSNITITRVPAELIWVPDITLYDEYGRDHSPLRSVQHDLLYSTWFCLLAGPNCPPRCIVLKPYSN